MIRLLHDFVLIKRVPIPETTKGGIHLPLKAIEVPQLGNIIAIGPKNPDNLQVNDLVLLKKFEGHRLEFEGELFHLLRIYDLLAVIKE